MRVLSAPVVVVSPDTVLDGGGVVVGQGRVQRLLTDRGAVRRAVARQGLELVELEECVLAPCTVDAHVHLELSALAGRVPVAGGFRAWVERLLELRPTVTREEALGAARAAADGLLRTGTGAVGDIDSSGLVLELARHPLRLVVFREALDAGDATRIPAVLDRLRSALPRRVGLREGLSPHAPFSVGPELARELSRLARRRRLPLAIHWAETPEEERFLRTGQGPFEGFVRAEPGPGGLERLERAGLLGPTTALVHGNCPGPGEVERVGRAGATVVHCPGSHAFFDRAPFPLEQYLAAGVPVALGTDSAASNDALDMRREMLLLRRSSGLGPAEVLRAATVHAARAIGLGAELGTLEPGRRADLQACAAPSGLGLADALALLTDGTPRVVGVWQGGRRVYAEPRKEPRPGP